MQKQTAVRIPYDQVSPETLDKVIEEFVTRDGTETAEAARSIERVRKLLRSGEVELWFDEQSRSCNILPAGTSAEG